ncbi:MAG TPA: sugar transferase [Candidatus Paceibacterota bacterium]|nr:sugar transferase [Verrucomicrobiota bacterium]HRZ47004.1 sugar transferase [Candidatus Paceibacterota bacterium]HRZ92874.1 sugar transferase [Candidatus Paceibacterota bacterium]
MLGQQQRLHTQFHKIVDAVLYGLAFFLAHLLRENWDLEVFGGTAEIEPFYNYAWLLLVVMPMGPLALEWQGYYRRADYSRRMGVWQLIRTGAILPVVVILILFLLKDMLSRSVIILFGGMSVAVMVAKEGVIWWWRRSRWGQAQAQRRFILVGTQKDNERFLREMRRRSSWGFRVVAELDLNREPVETLIGRLHEHSANGVVLNAAHAFFGQIEKAVQICELEGVEAWLMADFFKTQISRTMVDTLVDRPTLVFRSTPEESWEGVAKRLCDVAVASFLLLSTSWLFGLVAVLIKLTSPGPVYFRQSRSGLNGQPFTMYKFRSMTTDAEQRRHELERLNEMSGPVFKLSQDPRVTRVGYWLRRYSIDELPQLWNVLRGEMSLVGPRPLPVDEVKRFDDLAHRRRLSVKPGLTCLWQISGRNNVTNFNDWVRLDLEYIDNWSLWLDLKILVWTIPVVIQGTGAK